jgi:hypothetical protein
MNTPQERAAYIAKIRSFPDDLADSIAGLSPKEMTTPSEPGGWTPLQIVHHLADAHMNALIRFKLTLTESKPILKTTDQDAWANLPDSLDLPVESSLEILRALHVRWTFLLEHLPEDAWERQGVHLEKGLVSLDDLLRIYANHGTNHLEQIRRVKP